jgi:hypothetical protein
LFAGHGVVSLIIRHYFPQNGRESMYMRVVRIPIAANSGMDYYENGEEMAFGDLLLLDG